MSAPLVLVDREPDEALVARVRAGDPAGMPALVERYQRPLYNIAYRVLGNAEDAADVTQDVFLKLSERLDAYDARLRFFSWIYRVALNVALNARRARSRDEALEDADGLAGDERLDPAWSAHEAELSARVQRALSTLRPADRAVVSLRHFAELSYREIAEVLEIDEKTVKSRLHEARARLRPLLVELHAA